MRLQRDLLGLEGLHTVPDFAPRLRKPGKSCGRKGRLLVKTETVTIWYWRRQNSKDDTYCQSFGGNIRFFDARGKALEPRRTATAPVGAAPWRLSQVVFLHYDRKRAFSPGKITKKIFRKFDNWQLLQTIWRARSQLFTFIISWFNKQKIPFQFW